MKWKCAESSVGVCEECEEVCEGERRGGEGKGGRGGEGRVKESEGEVHVMCAVNMCLVICINQSYPVRSLQTSVPTGCRPLIL